MGLALDGTSAASLPGTTLTTTAGFATLQHCAALLAVCAGEIGMDRARVVLDLLRKIVDLLSCSLFFVCCFWFPVGLLSRNNVGMAISRKYDGAKSEFKYTAQYRTFTNVDAFHPRVGLMLGCTSTVSLPRTAFTTATGFATMYAIQKYSTLLAACEQRNQGEQKMVWTVYPE